MDNQYSHIETMYDYRRQEWLILIRTPPEFDNSKIFVKEVKDEVDNQQMSALGY